MLKIGKTYETSHLTPRKVTILATDLKGLMAPALGRVIPSGVRTRDDLVYFNLDGKAAYMGSSKDWQLKPPTKKVKIERWANAYYYKLEKKVKVSRTHWLTENEAIFALLAK